MKIVEIDGKYSIRRWDLLSFGWEYYDPCGIWWSPDGFYGQRYLKECKYSLEDAKRYLKLLTTPKVDEFEIWKKGGKVVKS